MARRNTIKDRIKRISKIINNLIEELPYANSRAEYARTIQLIDSFEERINKLAKDNDIELAIDLKDNVYFIDELN